MSYEVYPWYSYQKICFFERAVYPLCWSFGYLDVWDHRFILCAKVFWKTNMYPLGTLAHVDDPYGVMVVTWYKFIIMPQWLIQAFFSSLSDYRILRWYRRLPDVNWGCYPALSNKRCWPESAAFVPSIQSPLKVSDNCCHLLKESNIKKKWVIREYDYRPSTTGCTFPISPFYRERSMKKELTIFFFVLLEKIKSFPLSWIQ